MMGDNCESGACHACCKVDTAPSLRQSIDEMEFERGMWTAAIDNDVARILALLSKGHHPDVRDQSGLTPLHYAAKRGNLDACVVLVDKGACVNCRSRALGATPLHRAAGSGHLSVVSFLLSRGAVKDVKDDDGKTPLDAAREAGRDDVVALLA